MAAKPASPALELSATDPQGNTWTLDLASRSWAVSDKARRFTGKDAHRLAEKLARAQQPEAPQVPRASRAAPPDGPEQPKAPARLAVHVKRVAGLLNPNPAAAMEVVNAIDSPPHHRPMYATLDGQRLWGSTAHMVLDEAAPQAVDSVVGDLLRHKIDTLTVDPAREALLRWWDAKPVPPAAPDFPVATPWPVARPSDEPWTSKDGHLCLGQATVSMVPSAAPFHAPKIVLRYEGLGEVLSVPPVMVDLALHAGAAMHAQFGKAPPDQGIKAWVGMARPREKRVVLVPQMVQALACTMFQIPGPRGTVRPEAAVLSLRNGQFRWHPLHASLGPPPSAGIQVRAHDKNDEPFLEAIENLGRAARNAFNAFHPSRQPEASDPAVSVPAFRMPEQATPAQALEAATQWVAQVHHWIDTHPCMKALEDTVEPLKKVIDAQQPPSSPAPKPTRRRP